MADAKEIEKMFIGYDKGKVQPLEFYYKKETEEWTFQYKNESGNIIEVGNKDKDFMQAFFIEFGGKNPETCKAPSRFLRLDGDWGSKDLKKLGHTVTKITAFGHVNHRQRKHPYSWPDKTGSPGIIHAKAGQEGLLVVSERHREECSFTRSFSDPKDLDEIVKFLKANDCLRLLVVTIKRLHTISANGKHCQWYRCQAGDGTRKMVLELKYLDGEFFENIPRAKLFEAAGDMFDAVCMRIKMVKSKPFEKNICNLANEDGLVDTRGYEVANGEPEN